MKFSPRFYYNKRDIYFYVIVGISLLCTVFNSWIFSNLFNSSALNDLFTLRWSPIYLILSPFVHGGLTHLLFNCLAFYYIGLGMLRPLIGNKRLIIIFFCAIIVAHIANNLMSDSYAIGISGGVMGIIAASLYRYGNAPMKLLLIHDIFPFLPYIRFRNIVVFFVGLDICGIIFKWHFFAHWAHLGGFACGLAIGYAIFKTNPFRR